MYRDIEKIKSAEEYETIKKEIKYYVDEYNWILNSKNPKKEVEEEIKELIDKMAENQTPEQELQNLRAVHLLQNKYIAIKSGRYATDLKRNITADLVRAEQYEASLEQRSIVDILKGILGNDKQTKDYLQRKYMIFLVNSQGIIPDPVNLRLESIEDILEYIGSHYNLVGIELPKKEERSLVVTEETERNALEKLLNQKTEELIQENISTATRTITKPKPISTSKIPKTIKEKSKNIPKEQNEDERGI